MPREKWTDERLDDLNEKVDRGFVETKAEMREGFARLEARMEARMDRMEASTNAKFGEVSSRFGEIDANFGELNQRFDRLQQTLIGSAAAIVVAIIGSNAF